ncbi:MAG: CHAT domain-containing protein [Hyphomicrobiaceae bacterium]
MARTAQGSIRMWGHRQPRGYTPRGLFPAIVAVLALLPANGTFAQVRQPSKALQALEQNATRYYRAGNYEAALAESEKALARAISEFGSEHEQIGIRTYSLGLIADAAGKPEAAAGYYRQSVRVREKVYGPDSAGTAQALEMLGHALLRAGHIDEAETRFNRVLRIRSDLIGPDHAFTAGARASLADIQMARGNASAALDGYRRAVKLLTSSLSTQTIARTIDDQAIRRQRNAFVGLAHAAWHAQAQSPADRMPLMIESFEASQRAWSTAAASALAKMATRVGASDTDLGRGIREVQDLSERVLALHDADMKALAAWSRVQRSDKRYSLAIEEFRQASIAQARDNAPVVSRQKALVGRLQELLARCPPGRKAPGCGNSEADRKTIADELGKLSAQTAKSAPRLMELATRMQTAEKALPGFQKFHAARESRIAGIQHLETQIKQHKSEIARQFPDYAALSDPKPMSPQEVQALLAPEEVLVALLVGENESFVWAVTRERAAWSRIELGERALAEHVRQLRRGLDPLSQDPASGQSNVTPTFDVERAHEFYRLLLGPVATQLAGKQHLIVVPVGPLTSLPFQVLVTDKPVPAQNATEKVRNARWLIRRHAVSMLPSVPSLAALRRLAPPGAAPKPFIGIGDPILTGPPAAAPASPGQQRNLAARTGGISPAALYRAGSVDLRALNQLVPLPETAQELRTMAHLLGASQGDLLLRADATETRVKQMPLSNYRIVHFATHGLVAGELSGLAEPALVMTPPRKLTRQDDGLLSASEIATLRLQADWVILSACNTAAGDASGADALSGLARAFFYAGARALMVSHWAVYSDAAVALTTHTFAHLAKNPRLGRADAFRRSMLEMIGKGEPPSVWAPFVIVGEGGRPREQKR